MHLHVVTLTHSCTHSHTHTWIPEILPSNAKLKRETGREGVGRREGTLTNKKRGSGGWGCLTSGLLIAMHKSRGTESMGVVATRHGLVVSIRATYALPRLYTNILHLGRPMQHPKRQTNDTNYSPQECRASILPPDCEGVFVCLCVCVSVG